MERKEFSQERIDALVDKASGMRITLDGATAKVCGRLLTHARVARVDVPFEATFNWQSVERIINRDGKFQS